MGDLTTSNQAIRALATPGSGATITITCANSGATSDTTPQLVVYGLDFTRFDAKSSTAGTRAGWVHHLDTFREGSTGRQWPVCGFGGNFLAGHENANLAIGLNESCLPRIRFTHSASDRIVGPAFWETGSSPALTRGYLTNDAGDANNVRIESIVWVSTNVARFTVQGTTALSGTLSTVLKSNGDRLSVEQAPHSIFNGQFLITASALNSGTLTIDCEVPGLEDDRFDSTNCLAFAGVWTDAIETNGSGSPLPPTSRVLASNAVRTVFTNADINTGSGTITKANAWTDNQELVFNVVSGTAPTGLVDGTSYWTFRIDDSSFKLRSSFDGSIVNITAAGSGTFELEPPSNEDAWVSTGNSGTTTYIEGVARRLLIPGGRVVKASYTGKVVQLRDVGGSTATAGNFVEGDVLSVDSHTESVRPKIKSYSGNADLSVTSITGDGATATVIMATSSVSNMAVGDSFMVAGAPHFSGEITVAEILSSTSFTFESTVEATDNGAGIVLMGETIAVDLDTDWEDGVSDAASTVVDLYRRWQPIEFVESPNTALIDFNTVQHLDYFDDELQPFVKSVMSHDSMYFTNGYDEVFKYDGVNLIRAGLPPQQLNFIGGPTTGAIELIPFKSNDITLSATTDTLLTFLTEQDALNYSEGDVAMISRPRHNNSKSLIQFKSNIKGKTMAATELGHLYVDSAVDYYSFTPVKIHPIKYLAYYGRLNSVDRNGKVTGSAICSIYDNVYPLGPQAQGQMKWIRPAAWPGLDHARLEIQPYRRLLDAETLSVLPAPDSKINYDLVRPILTSWSTGDNYYTLKDTYTALPRNPDTFNYAIKGVEIANQLNFPPRAKCISAAAGRLLAGNVRGYQTFDLRLISLQPSDNSLIYSNIFGASITLRKGADNTRNTSVMKFKYVSTLNYPYGLISDLRYETVDTQTFRLVGSAGKFTGFAQNDWVYITTYMTTDHEQLGSIADVSLEYMGLYQVSSTDGNTYVQLKAPVRTGLTINSVDTVNETITLSAAHSVPVGSSIIVSVRGSLPGGLVEKYSYKATATSSTALKLYHPVTGAVINLTSGTTGGVVEFGCMYSYAADNGAPFSSAGLSVAVASSDYRDIPIPIGKSDASLPTVKTLPTQGLETAANRVLNTDQSFVNMIAMWTSHLINAAQSACIQSGFRPWLIARAGEDYASGEIHIESPIANTETSTITMDFSASNQITPYVNSTLMTSGVAVNSKELKFPSRLCRSALNYPEVFDDPYNPSADNSDSAIDVDPASGGEITAVIPMFGESSFGAAQLASSVLVAKTNGWYEVDVESKAYTKLDTNGIGCDFPRTVTATKNGIMFAHRSGLYKINRSKDIVYLGQILGRKWNDIDTADDVDITLANATHDAKRNRYIASLPTVDNEEDEAPVHYAFSYDHTREVNPAGLSASGGTNGLGSWTEYDNIPSLGWTNLGNDSLFATADGRVHARNRSGTELDYRDDESAIEATAVYKLMNFGVTGLRKVLRGLVLTFRTVTSQLGTKAFWADSARLAFRQFDDFTLTAGTPQDGVSDELTPAIHTVKLSAPDRKGDLMTFKIENNSLNENVTLTDVTFFIDPLADHGIREADGDDP
jgi:hypothetical protein